jgi:SAM-dependent methyltransferase
MEQTVTLRSVKEQLLDFARRVLPLSTRRTIIRLTRWPPVRLVRWGSLRRLCPISPDWGLERGKPIDRYYIEKFLEGHAADIRGNVLEIGDNFYTRQYGGDRVSHSDVLHVAEQNPGVTIIGDLANAGHLASDAFDCIILTQTLQTIYDLNAAVKTIHRILKPNGVVLVTVPGISKISRYDMDHWGYFWSFTSQSARRLFADSFGAPNVTVKVYGNVLASVAFLHGLAVSEVRRRELEYFDPDYELLIGVRAIKPEGRA